MKQSRIKELEAKLALRTGEADAKALIIKELEAELLETQDRANAFATKEYHTEVRAKRAEAKLAKAVAFLVELRDSGALLRHPFFLADLIALIAELKGGQNND